MLKLTFSELAKILQPYINNNSSQPKTALEIINQIVDDKSQDLIEYNENTFKNYYSGKSRITRLANRISGHLDQTKFDSYLSKLDYGALTSISNSLKKYGIDDARPGSVSTICAKELIKIIDDATKRQNTSKNVGKIAKKTSSSITQDLSSVGSSLSDKIEKRFRQLYGEESLADIYYSLIISYGLKKTINGQGMVSISNDRKFEYTDESIKDYFLTNPLRMKTIPLLICIEKQDGPTNVYCCEITNYSDRGKWTHIQYKVIGQFSYQLFDENYAVFGVFNDPRSGWGENNRTHLSIKGNSLLQILRDLGD